ncbi:hypothetical protein Anapl_09127 [Anas platyrhynchos]|uniref:Uncharacterized protein n=1 Tax=Anas platyrhynchos TaxID=8839 RepID=R0LCK7_ANAPL|nr:hypothetical protein Anapl_09127 [Anas platyrhynchos]
MKNRGKGGATSTSEAYSGVFVRQSCVEELRNLPRAAEELSPAEPATWGNSHRSIRTLTAVPKDKVKPDINIGHYVQRRGISQLALKGLGVSFKMVLGASGRMVNAICRMNTDLSRVPVLRGMHRGAPELLQCGRGKADLLGSAGVTSPCTRAFMPPCKFARDQQAGTEKQNPLHHQAPHSKEEHRASTWPVLFQGMGPRCQSKLPFWYQPPALGLAFEEAWLLREQTKLVRSWASAAAKLLGSTSTHPAKRPCELPATLRGGGYQRGIFTGWVLLPADMGLVISTQGSCASGKSGALHVTWPQPNSEMAVQALRKYQCWRQASGRAGCRAVTRWQWLSVTVRFFWIGSSRVEGMLFASKTALQGTFSSQRGPNKEDTELPDVWEVPGSKSVNGMGRVEWKGSPSSVLDLAELLRSRWSRPFAGTSSSGFINIICPYPQRCKSAELPWP